MQYLYLMDKTIYKMSHDILYKMWVVDFYSYVPLTIHVKCNKNVSFD